MLNVIPETKIRRKARNVLLMLTLGSLATSLPAAYAADAAQNDTTQTAQDEGEHSPLIAKGLDEKGGGISLTSGQSRLVVARRPIRTVDVTQPDVVLANVVSPTDIMLTGRKPGSSQLVVWDDQGRSQSIEIIVTADVASLQAELKKAFPSAKVDVSMANGAIVLRGHVPNAQMADQVAQLAGPYAPKVINLLEISGGQQVTLQVRFAEVSKSAVEALGVNFGVAGSGGFVASTIGGVAPFGVTESPGAVGVPVLSVPSPGSGVTAFGRVVIGETPLDVFLTAMKENNLLRVLAEPNLTTMSGQQASFLAGGEFPYPVPQSSGGNSTSTVITIEFKQFGVRLNFTPVVLGDGRIRLQVNPEVSDLDFTNSLQLNGFVIPAITTRTASTVVELNEGQTLAMAGLLSTRVNANNTSTPLLGDLPIIGALFRSVRYERDETELVVMVTPRLAAGLNPGHVPALPGEHWRYPTEGELYLNADLGGPSAEAASVPSRLPPRQFQGTYGFVPTTAPVAKAK